MPKKKISKVNEVVLDTLKVEETKTPDTVAILSTDLGRGDLNELRDKINELIEKFNGR